MQHGMGMARIRMIRGHMPSQPYSVHGKSLRLAVRLTPRARKDEAAGIVTDSYGKTALAVRLTAPPVDGEANKALIAFLAKALKVPKADIRIASGTTARLKLLEIEGDIALLSARLDGLASGKGGEDRA